MRTNRRNGIRLARAVPVWNGTTLALMCALGVVACVSRTSGAHSDRQESIRIKWLESCAAQTPLFQIKFMKDGAALFEGSAATRVRGLAGADVGEEHARTIFAAANELLKKGPGRKADEARHRPEFCVELSKQGVHRSVVRRVTSGRGRSQALLKAIQSALPDEQWVCPPRMAGMNRGALGWISCSELHNNIAVQLHLQTPEWCGGSEGAEIYRDGTIHHYQYRGNRGGFDLQFEEFLSLTGEEIAQLRALLRDLPLREQDPSIAESRSGVTIGPVTFGGRVSEAEAVSAWLSKNTGITWLSQRQGAIACESAYRPSHLTVYEWYLKP
jgi:hypothetical protein